MADLPSARLREAGALARLYNRYDCRPPKHLLEAALTGRSQVEIAIASLRGQARWNIAKARDWERAACLAEANGHPLRARLQRGDARFHRAIARRRYREAARLEADERPAARPSFARRPACAKPELRFGEGRSGLREGGRPRAAGRGEGPARRSPEDVGGRAA